MYKTKILFILASLPSFCRKTTHMQYLERLTSIIIFSCLILVTADAQSKFEIQLSKSDFRSAQQSSTLNYNALKAQLKYQTPQTLSSKPFSPSSFNFLSNQSSNSKSLLIKKIEENHKVVWLEVEPSSITKNGDMIAQSYRLLSEYSEELG
ncbi:MAG: hypothetical protein ACI9FN_002061 [Saprospiraceae bacterium]|jgi:hypothetical protein